jgi:hypothetical protein
LIVETEIARGLVKQLEQERRPTVDVQGTPLLSHFVQELLQGEGTIHLCSGAGGAMITDTDILVAAF